MLDTLGLHQELYKKGKGENEKEGLLFSLGVLLVGCSVGCCVESLTGCVQDSPSCLIKGKISCMYKIEESFPCFFYQLYFIHSCLGIVY